MPGGDVRGWHVDIVAENHAEAEYWGVQERLIITRGWSSWKCIVTIFRIINVITYLKHS